jgi:hypothetical protein
MKKVKEKKVKMRQDEKENVKYKMMRKKGNRKQKIKKVDEDVKGKENDGEDGSRSWKKELKKSDK